MKKFIITEIETRKFVVLADNERDAVDCISEPEFGLERGYRAFLVERKGETIVKSPK